MSDPSAAVQKAIFEVLNGAAIVGGRIYDEPPGDVEFPYVVIGEGDTVDDGNSCFDASEVNVQVHVWSRKASFAECKTIGSDIRTALSQPLTLEGFGNPVALFVFARWLRDPDGKTKHGALQFRYLVDHPIS